MMTKAKWYEVIKLIATCIVATAAVFLVESCISSLNVNKNSEGATINSKQAAEQKNDSTNIEIELKK